MLFLFLGFLLLTSALDLRFSRDRADRREEAERILENAILSGVEECHTQKWLFRKIRLVMNWSRKHLANKPFSEITAEFLGRTLGRLFPSAKVFAFSSAGKIVFQSKPEPMKPREIFWKGVVTLQNEGGGDHQEKRFQTAERFCRSMYGTLTNISDMVQLDGYPRLFPDHGRMRFSWVLSEQNFSGKPPSGHDEHLGGVWLIMNPGDFSMKNIAKAPVAGLVKIADTAMILQKRNNRPRIELKRGNGNLRESIARKFFAGEIAQADQDGNLWVGRYIPNENGRFMLAGIRADHLYGIAERHRWIPLLLYFFFTGAFFGFSYSHFWLGEPLRFKLSHQVFVLFMISSILPMLSVLIQGANLADDTALRSRKSWEQRIVAFLKGIDYQYNDYKKLREKKLRQLEAAMAAFFPFSAASEKAILNLCGEFNRYCVLMVDEHARFLKWTREMESIQDRGEFANLMAVYFSRFIEVEGRIPDPAFAKIPSIFSGHEQDKILETLFRPKFDFNRMKVKNRPILQRQSVVLEPGSVPPRTIGMISWLFDETEFSRPFMETMLRTAASRQSSNEFSDSDQPDEAGAFVLGFASPDGDLFPANLGASPALKRMVERVARFQANETGTITFPSGKSCMAVVHQPANLGGYLMIGMIESSPPGNSHRFSRDCALILGLRPILPLDKERITTLRILFLSLILSLMFILPMAAVLSRWIVGRLLALQLMIDEISQNNLAIRAEVTADDELGQLAQSFNDMAGGLQERERMSRFVSEQVLEEVKKEDGESLALGGRHCQVAVLFTHLQHFDELLLKHHPEDMIDMLNSYFTLTAGLIGEHQGTIDKLIGDAVMAVFFDIPGGKHPAYRAVQAAQKILSEKTRYNSLRKSNLQFEVRTDVGIHYGTVISGKVGSHHGMIDFTVIGDTVNTAARIQSTAGEQIEPSILISGEVRKHLPNTFFAFPLEKVFLKGKEGYHQLFRV